MGIINGFRTDEFVAYFTKVPQNGPNSSYKVLDSDSIDLLNQSIKGVTLPSFSFSDIPVQYGAELQTRYTGDTYEVSNITVSFLLDRTFINYKCFLNWSMLQKNVVDGLHYTDGYNNDNTMGVFVIQFLDSNINVADELNLDIRVMAVPSISLNVTENTDILFDIEFATNDLNFNSFYNRQT